MTINHYTMPRIDLIFSIFFLVHRTKGTKFSNALKGGQRLDFLEHWNTVVLGAVQLVSLEWKKGTLVLGVLMYYGSFKVLGEHEHYSTRRTNLLGIL